MGQPAGGWGSLLTKDHLDARLDTLAADLTASMDRLLALVDRRLRTQTWITTGALITGITLAFAIGQ
jgi:hypothetical protein